MPKDWAPGEVLASTDLDTYMLQPGTTGTGTRLVAGSTSGSFSNQGAVSGTVTYGFTFSSAPKVIPVVVIGANFDVGINWTATPGTTSVGYRAWQRDDVLITGSFTIHWLAIGPG